MVEQEWQRRKRRFACRNKAPAQLIPSHPPNNNKLFHHSCTQASYSLPWLHFDVREIFRHNQSRSECKLTESNRLRVAILWFFFRELLDRPRSLLKQPQRCITQLHDLSKFYVHHLHREEQGINSISSFYFSISAYNHNCSSFDKSCDCVIGFCGRFEKPFSLLI